MTDRICVAEHYRDPDRPRRAAEGSMLCAGCESRLAKQLENLSGLYADVLAGSRKVSSTGPVKGDPERPMPATGTQLDARELVRATLVPWCRIVAEERVVDPPDDTVPAMCAFLERHRLWLCGHDAAAEFADEIAHVSSEALRAAYPGGRRRMVLGPCVGRVSSPDGTARGCDGIITATVSPADDLLPSFIVCDTDPEHLWTSSEWARLGLKIHGLLDTATAALVLDVTERTVRRMVESGELDNHGSAKRIYVHEGQVVALLATRRQAEDRAS